MANSAFPAQVAGGSSGYSVLSAQNASGPSVTFSGLSDSFIAYELFMINYLPSVTSDLILTFNGDAAAHYSYSFTYSASSIPSPGTVNASTVNNILLLENVSAIESSNMKLILYNPSAVDEIGVTWNSQYVNSDVNLVTVNGAGHRFINGAITSMTLAVDAGVMSSGRFILCGIAAP